MKTFQKKGFISSLSLMIFLAGGCLPTMVSISTPEIRNVENDYFSAQLEPLSQGKNYFDRFRLAVTNKTSQDLEIDWNQTRYLYHGRDGGVFVFEGIAAEDIKNETIPPGIIPVGQTFTKEIGPLELVARGPLGGKGADSGKITFGIIPSGENGILLVIRQNGKTLEEKIMVKISQREVPK
ncbi:MAG: hypothetical protein LJE63_14000 [Desulfobacteraceae bacterium]|nr:hypothetical protein [Desulfobacteraceae bacterium]